MGIKARDWAWQQASKVPPVPLLVLLAIAESCYGESVSATIGQRRLAGRLQRDQATVSRSVRELVAAGLVRVDQGTGRHSQRSSYTLQTDDVTSETDDAGSSEPMTSRHHVPGVPAQAGTTPAKPPSAAAGAAASLRSQPAARRGKRIEAAGREYNCAECRLPGESGMPARWWREDGEIVTAHVECPPLWEQQEHWRWVYKLPDHDDVEGIAKLVHDINDASPEGFEKHKRRARRNFQEGYGNDIPQAIRDAFNARLRA
jgi:hypothetical protein